MIIKILNGEDKIEREMTSGSEPLPLPNLTELLDIDRNE